MDSFAKNEMSRMDYLKAMGAITMKLDYAAKRRTGREENKQSDRTFFDDPTQVNNSDNENEESDDSLSETRRHFSESESGSDTAFPSRKIGKRGKKLNKKVCKRKSVLLKKNISRLL